MRSKGFTLTSLKLSGSGVEDAQVDFKKGLNVISGPSDTGKTYIAQCIDYMFGASKPPKYIEEAVRYEYATLGIRSYNDDTEVFLKRGMKGGDATLIGADGTTLSFGAKHNKNSESTVSHFFLKLSCLAGAKIRTNQSGNTRFLSFRDISKLIFVSEEAVISETSPILTGQYTKRTAEESVFNLLLTQVDDSSIVQHVEIGTIKTRSDAEIELLAGLIKKTKDRIVELGVEDDVASVRDRLSRTQAVFEQARIDLQVEQQSVSEIEMQRKSIWTELRKIDSRISVLSELQQRFELLKEQYSSDLRRLDALSEAAFRLAQMKEERCPICGALAEYHDHEDHDSSALPEKVAQASLAEKVKIEILLSDLDSTILSNSNEIKNLQIQLDQKSTTYQSILNEFESNIQPRLQAYLQRITDSQEHRDKLSSVVELFDRIEEYQYLLETSQNSQSTNTGTRDFKSIGSKEIESFSKTVESILRSWQYPNLDRVIFDNKDLDLVISGQPRSSHGKGVRAITHAAFNLALLQYCKAKKFPHPGLVLIDSPLVVYREPDKNESGFAPDLKNAFYKSLAEEFAEMQVIIFENDEPPSDIANSANLIKFTGTPGEGRPGFIPSP